MITILVDVDEDAVWEAPLKDDNFVVICEYVKGCISVDEKILVLV